VAANTPFAGSNFIEASLDGSSLTSGEMDIASQAGPAYKRQLVKRK
jgi:hypothetical protein